MKRTDTLTRLVSLLLFGAFLAYLGVYIVRAATDNVRTAPAVFVSLTENGIASGLVVRNESLIESSEKFLSVVAESGKLVSTGEAVAVIYSGEDALERAARIRELELKKKYISSVLSGSVTADSLSNRDSSIKEALIALAASAARHDTDSLAAASMSLSSLVITNSEINTTQVDLNLVSAELDSLKQSALSDTSAITASSPGLFSISPDGYEYITPDMLTDLTPTRLSSLEASPHELADDVRGKLVTPFEWYFAAAVSEADAKRIKVGQTATLNFGRYSSTPLKAKVLSISTAQNGECALVFRCTEANFEMLFVRRATAEIFFEAHEGLRVPKQALLSDEEGFYVYTLTGMQAEKKYIDIVWETEDYFLAATSPDAASLRSGNDIILTTKGLYDGKIMNN